MISPTSKRFVVVPQGGLGNRMRVIRSAYELARSGYGDVHVALPATMSAIAVLRTCSVR